MVDEMECWVSPVELISKEILTKFNECIDDKIQEVIEFELGVNIDRDELIKAMNYDREQFAEGFKKGYAKRDKEIVRCKDCKHCEHQDFPTMYFCFRTVDCFEVDGDFYCKDGERKEEE